LYVVSIYTEPAMSTVKFVVYNRAFLSLCLYLLMSEVHDTKSVMYGLSKIAHLWLVFIMMSDRMSMTANTTDIFPPNIIVIMFQNEDEYQIP